MTTHASPGRKAHSDEAAMLLAVMRELAGVIEDENVLLSRRLPAGLTPTIERKAALSEDYEDLWRGLFAQGIGTLANDREMVDLLIASAARLRKLVGENMTRLEAAADASRRRIEAVMAAVRDQDARARGYGAGGEVRAGGRSATTLTHARA